MKTKTNRNRNMPPTYCVRVWGLGVGGLEFGVWGEGFEVWGIGFRVWNSPLIPMFFEPLLL